MRRVVFSFIALILMMTACARKKDQTVRLKPGTESYEFAARIAEKIPYFDPDANNVLASGKDLRITTGTVIKQMHVHLGPMTEQLLATPEDRMRQIIQTHLENAVYTELLLNRIEKEKIKVTSAELDSMLQYQYDRAGSKDAFIEQISKSGLSLDDVKQDMEQRLLINTYFDRQYGDEVLPTEEELLDLYHQDITATVRHILFRTQGRTEEEKEAVRKNAETVLAQAKNGRNFVSLVKKYSEDPGSKDKGGLYKDFKRGEMVQAFEEASFNLPVGSVSDLVETPFGYHIIKVIERKKEERPFEEVRWSLKEQLEKQKKQEIFDQHIKELEAEAEVEYALF